MPKEPYAKNPPPAQPPRDLTFRLASGPMIHTPGVVKAMQHNFQLPGMNVRSKAHALLTLMASFPDMPCGVMLDLLSGKCEESLEGPEKDTLVVKAKRYLAVPMRELLDNVLGSMEEQEREREEQERMVDHGN